MTEKNMNEEKDLRELLYFPFCDLMVQFSYQKQSNCLKYCTHKEMAFEERVIIEQYLLFNIALQTDYYNSTPAIFSYWGVGESLQRDYDCYTLKQALIAKKERESAVKLLIAGSFEDYYFKQIWKAILILRRNLKKDPPDQWKIEKVKGWILKSIQAYDLYSKKEIRWKDIIPSDLWKYFED